MFTPRLGVAATGMAIVLLCGGVAAAAAGVVADDPTGTTSPTPSPTRGGPGEDGRGQGGEKAKKRGVGPDAAGPAHHGLCTAWSHVKDTPGRAADSPPFRNLQEVGCDDVATTPGSRGDGEGKGEGKGEGRAKGKAKKG